MNTIKVYYEPSMRSEPTTKNVVVMSGNMFELAFCLSQEGKSISLHNFANNIRPGLFRTDRDGNHYWLYNTQEEQLLRATTINGKTFLPLDLYPIRETVPATLFTKNVNVDILGYKYNVNIITCPAIMDPLLTPDNNYLPNVEEDVIQSMILVLSVAGQNSDVLVTGLWGCGAFNHPITASLKAWKKAIEQVKTPPKEIYFCYMKDGLTNILSGEENEIGICERYLID